MKWISRIIRDFLTRHPPDRKLWLDILLEVVLIGGIYCIYSLSRGSVGTASVAFEHARDIIDVEKTLGIFIELDIQSFFLESPLRMDIANSLYTYCYYPPLVIFALWSYWRHRNKYKIMRTAFLISAFLAFTVFAAYPVAPPRFFDGTYPATENLGFVDTLFVHWGVNDKSVSAFYNPFAAMPSLHQAWTLMVGGGIIWMTKSWIGRIIGVALPCAMFVGIVSTANHFILDAIGGALIMAISIGLTVLLLKRLGRYESRDKEVIEARQQAA
ncbi:MAG: phosphatase PAP2 family protein [Dehalococcoidia bacterium]